MRIITAANERYFGPITPYLNSLSVHSQVPATLVCVGDRQLEYADIQSVQLSRNLNSGAPRETESPQHGAWLQVVQGSADEVCIFTDGDIIMQRPFNYDELNYLSDLDGNTVACGYNSGPGETLTDEARRLYPHVGMDALARVFGKVDTIPCYNIGVIAARRSVFQRIYHEYMSWWELVSDAFGHAARQQWLVCWVMHELGLNVDITPYSLHANGHYGMPPGCRYGHDNLLYSGEQLVLFRHKL